MSDRQAHSSRWRRRQMCCRRACASTPGDWGSHNPVLALSCRRCRTATYTSSVAPRFRPCVCPLALSGPGQAVASVSYPLGSGHLGWQFLPCVTRRTLSAQPPADRSVQRRIQRHRWTAPAPPLGCQGTVLGPPGGGTRAQTDAAPVPPPSTPGGTQGRHRRRCALPVPRLPLSPFPL